MQVEGSYSSHPRNDARMAQATRVLPQVPGGEPGREHFVAGALEV